MLLVVQSEAVEHVRARLVDAGDRDVDALAAVFEDDLVERADGGDVPQMGLRDVDRDLAQRLAEIEGGDEALGRSEEDLPVDLIGALVADVSH